MQFLPSSLTNQIEPLKPLLEPVLQQTLNAMAIDHPASSAWLDAYLPLTQWISERKKNEPYLLMINGAQGSGKTTATELLKIIFEQHYNYQVATLSIDDFYLSRRQRQLLADHVHPLLATRGVPGTHDIHLLASVLDDLKHRRDTVVPVFSKAEDDLLPADQWQAITSDVDIIILEGWCVGAKSQSNIDQACNALEANEDTDSIWRRYVNTQLQELYEPVYQLADTLVMLRAPDFNCVFDWRVLQEEKLRRRYPDKGMNPEELIRFIHHYERLTQHMLSTMPTYADWIYYLNHQHWFDCVELKQT